MGARPICARSQSGVIGGGVRLSGIRCCRWPALRFPTGHGRRKAHNTRRPSGSLGRLGLRRNGGRARAPRVEAGRPRPEGISLCHLPLRTRPRGAGRRRPRRVRSGLRQVAMYSNEIRAQLERLNQERIEAEAVGLTACESYVADLEEEISEWRAALMGAVVTEIAV